MKLLDIFNTHKHQLFRGERKEYLPMAEEIMRGEFADVEFDSSSDKEEVHKTIDEFTQKLIISVEKYVNSKIKKGDE